MKNPLTSARAFNLALIFLALVFLRQAPAASVSVNFEGRESNVADSNLLDPADFAGVVAVANWNNASGATGNLTNLIDDSGAATSTDVTWNGQSTWSWEQSGDAVPSNGGGSLFNGYLDTSGNNGSHSITVSQVPFAEYDVYVYVDGENNGSARPARFNIGGGADVWIDDDANWNGSYVEGAGTNLASATAGANYVRFTGLSGGSFTINAVAETFRAAVNGFQIVETVVTPGLPEITNLAAQNITSTSAQARADLIDNGDGNDSATVTFYWGTADAGTDTGAWGNSVNGGSFTAPTSPVTTTLSGLEPNTTYFYRAFVSNSAGDDWAPETETFATLAALPAVDNIAASDVLAFGATLGAMVTGGGGEAPAVTIHYGEVDAGTGVWENMVSLGTIAESATQTVEVSGLSQGTTYFFRASAENSAGLVWADASGSFTTTALSAPTVVTLAATNVTGISATLKGEVTDDGGDPPVVSFYYGKTDGGTTAANWDELVQVGIDSGNFSKAVGNLDPESGYFFRAHAQNAAGGAWAAESLTFDTPMFVAPTIVINEIHYDEVDKTLPAEFIELYNNSDNAIDLSGWYFSSGIDFVFPDGTMIAADSYLVIAQDPGTVASEFGFGSAIGPWVGGLRNSGETVELRDVSGNLVDTVDYRLGFPWPTVGEAPSPSIELISPDLDNDLGGSWRSSGLVPPNPGVAPADYVLRNSNWSYHLGDSFPTTDGSGKDWNENGYDESVDGGWILGQAPVGFGDGDDNTTITRDHITVFLRKEFTIAAGQIPSNLTLRTLYDDGIVVWINGVEVGRYSVDAGAIQFPPPGGFANNHEADDYEEFTLTGVAAYLVEGTNTLALQGINSGTGSSDLTTEAELVFTGSTGGTPTNSDPSPGAPNSVFVNNAPPALRQVEHLPTEPKTGDPVVVTIKATDLGGIGTVELEYQIVEPGDYIKLSDPRYQTGWIALPMNDDGTGGDAFAGDDVYSVTLPGSLQTHRRLIRYRINAEDTDGASVTAPYSDDRQPNFAYFTYDGVPAWTGRGTPSLPNVTYDFDTIGTGAEQYPYQQQVPVYHLITTREEHEESQHIPNASSGSYGGSEYRWEGALVYDGQVYDHIRFRARGGVWRYAMGKNMWKFDFNRGRRFEARDNYGERYDTDWSKLNFSSLIQQGNFRQRGEQGLFEWGGFKLHNLVGNPAPNTHFVQFRIVEHADEEGPSASQYDDDFQGLYLVVEQMDGQFLEEHDLPDGNLYKMEGGSGELNNQGPTLPSNKSDLNEFFAYKNSQQTVQWWQDNLNLDDYYSFRAIATAIHDYDIHANKNYFYFHDPLDDRWRVLNWDLDLTWTTSYGGGGINGPLSSRVLAIPEFARDYRNRMREILDLVFNDDQTGKILDECARFIHTPGQPSLADADRAMWDHNPIMTSGLVNSSKAGAGKYYEGASQRNFAAMIDHVKNYIGSQTNFINGNSTNLSNEDATIPATPTISYTGGVGFPSNGLSFSSGNFSDPQGDGTFAAMKWRVGEVYYDGIDGYVPGDPYRYEIEEVYTSDEIGTFDAAFTFPVTATRPGRTYRARVRHKDADGNWSHWSDPVEFTASAPDVSGFQDSLVISEFMYHPTPATGEEAALGFSNSDFEWIELQNVGAEAIEMTGVRFTKGVDFDFPDGYEIPSGGYAIIARDAAAFAFRYGAAIPIAGEYGPDSLSNGGENVKLSFGAGTGIIEFTYDDEDPWPTAADGDGFSLVLIDPASLPDHAVAINWRASATRGGTPGSEETGGFTGDPDADDDGDRFNRLLEYAFGTDDSDPGNTPEVTFATAGDGTLTLTLQRNLDATDVTITVQKSLDLKTWQPAPEITVQSEEPQGDGTALVTYSGDIGAGADRYYLRVLVTLD